MPVNSTAGTASATRALRSAAVGRGMGTASEPAGARANPGPREVRSLPLLRRRGDLDLAVDDLLLEVVDLRLLDELAAVGGVVDAAVARSPATTPAFRSPFTKSLIAPYTATSTRLSIEVRMHFCWSALAPWYWFGSVPSARRSAATAAWNTPSPDLPAPWKTTSTSFSYMPAAMVLPLAGSSKPVTSPSGAMYFTSTSTSGRRPSRRPRSRPRTSGSAHRRHHRRTRSCRCST